MRVAGTENPEPDENSEIIVLDVRLQEMIHSRAFRATLENGHAMVAYYPRKLAGEASCPWSVGDRAKVRMSPFDMSRGELIIV
jgi:translation initiation factor IF-1